MKTTLKIEGMSCEHCVRAVQSAALSVEGVQEAQVDLATKTAVLTHGEAANLAAVKAAIEEEDFQVSPA